MTEWRKIPGWNAYEVSEDGQVRRDGVIRKPYLSNSNPRYHYLALRQDGRIQAMGVHRMVALAFIGPPPFPKAQVAHGDGQALHNHYRNLRWATHAENQADRVLHGTSNRGERQHMARLTEAGAIEAKIMLGIGFMQKEVAAYLGVARTTIQAIANGRTWSWIAEWKLQARWDEMLRCAPASVPLLTGGREVAGWRPNTPQLFDAARSA